MSNEIEITSKIINVFKKSWIRLLFAIIIIISIVIYLQNIDQDLQLVFEIYNPRFFFFSIPFVFVSLISHVLAWRLIIGHFGQRLDFFKALYIYFFSSISRYIPGNYWHIVFRSSLGLKFGVDFKTGFKGTVIELFLNSFIGAIFILLGLALNVIKLKTKQLYWLLLFLIISLTLLIILFLLSKKENISINKSKFELIRQKFSDELSHLWKFSITELLGIIFWFSLAWISQGILFNFVLSIWNITERSHFLLIMFSYVTAWFMGFINPIAQSGVGIREAVFMITLGDIFPIPIILGASLIIRLLVLIGEILLFFIGWIGIKQSCS